MDVMEWFYKQEELYKLMDQSMQKRINEEAQQARNAVRPQPGDSDDEDTDGLADSDDEELYEVIILVLL